MTIDPHPQLPASEGWQPASTAPKTAELVQIGYPPDRGNKPAIITAHYAQDLSGEEQPPFKGWFCHNLGDGGRIYGFSEVPSGWIACRHPGRYCTGFNVTGRAPASWRPLEVYVWLATVRHRDEAMGNTGMPFMPLWVPPGADYWRFWCPRLGRDGRCTDYDNRPGLCRRYDPGTDALCAMHEGWYPPAAQAAA